MSPLTMRHFDFLERCLPSLKLVFLTSTFFLQNLSHIQADCAHRSCDFSCFLLFFCYQCYAVREDKSWLSNTLVRTETANQKQTHAGVKHKSGWYQIKLLCALPFWKIRLIKQVFYVQCVGSVFPLRFQRVEFFLFFLMRLERSIFFYAKGKGFYREEMVLNFGNCRVLCRRGDSCLVEMCRWR